MRRRQREAELAADHAEASAWLHEMSQALDHLHEIDVRDVMAEPVLVGADADDQPMGRVRPLRARRLEAAT